MPDHLMIVTGRVATLDAKPIPGELPILTAEEEDTIVRQHEAIRRLGVKSVPRHRIMCPRCGCAYNIGSRHRGSLFCIAMHRRVVLRERGMGAVSFTYVDWLREARIPFEVHLTREEMRGSGYDGSDTYRGVYSLSTQLWAPKDIPGVLGHAKTAKVHRMRKLVELRERQSAEWAASEIGLHGLRWINQQWVP